MRAACERFILWLDGILWPQEWPRPLRMALTGAVLGTAASGVAALLMVAWALIALAVTA